MYKKVENYVDNVIKKYESLKFYKQLLMWAIIQKMKEKDGENQPVKKKTVEEYIYEIENSIVPWGLDLNLLREHLANSSRLYDECEERIQKEMDMQEQYKNMIIAFKHCIDNYEDIIATRRGPPWEWGKK